MAILRGRWTLTAIGNEAGWKQSVLITGSDETDGFHEMVVGTVVGPVKGAAFEVKPHAWNPDISSWIPSNEREVMSFDPDKGVIVTVYADDDPGVGADNDFNDLVVECTADERELRPPEVSQRPLDLTIPEQAIGRRSPNAPWF